MNLAANVPRRASTRYTKRRFKSSGLNNQSEGYIILDRESTVWKPGRGGSLKATGEMERHRVEGVLGRSFNNELNSG